MAGALTCIVILINVPCKRLSLHSVRLLAGIATTTTARGKKPGVLSQSVSFHVQGAVAVMTMNSAHHLVVFKKYK
jgi:hypothetical protein